MPILKRRSLAKLYLALGLFILAGVFRQMDRVTSPLPSAVCFLLTLGILSFVPLVMNYLARPKAAHTFVYSHHTWQIRSFWWYFVWGCTGSVLFVTFIGIPGALIVWILAWGWYAYRLIAGFTTLDKHLPMPCPDH